MFLSELDVVNDCLASLGEAPLNAMDDEHPFVSAALSSLKAANLREQSKGWWFNRETLDLQPDPATNFIYVPADTISVDPADQWQHLVQRGRRLYDPNGAGYVIGKTVRATLLRLLPYEELPGTAAAYIGPCAVADFQRNYDADRMKVEQNAQLKREAYITLKAEDIRNAGVNLLQTPSMLAKFGAIGGTGRQLSRHSGRYYPGTTATPVPPTTGGEVPPCGEDLPYVDFAAIFNEAVDS